MNVRTRHEDSCPDLNNDLISVVLEICLIIMISRHVLGVPFPGLTCEYIFFHSILSKTANQVDL